MDERNSKFFKIYFILAIIFAIVGLFSSFFHNFETWGQTIGVDIYFISIYSIAIFILSIVAVYSFWQNKFSKITLIIPIYYIVIFILTFVYGLMVGFLTYYLGILLSEIPVPPESNIISLFTSLFELFFSMYVLNKFR